MIDRRTILKHIALVGGLPVCPRLAVFNDFPPIRRLTRGPGHHFFGYYDKFQFDGSGRFVLGMRVDFEGRAPRPDDALSLGLIDLEDGDQWKDIGRSTAWGWQQGCMLQWRPGHDRQVMWNDREGDRYVCRILDLDGGEEQTIPYPVYSVAPDGRTAMSLDFRRVQAMRPGYGYVGLPDPHQTDPAPKDSGIFRVNLEDGTRELVLSIADIAAIEPRTPDMDGASHYVNHLLVSPDGRRFIFLHRWRPDGGRGHFRTRMFTANLDGTEPHLIESSGRVSHFIWQDARRIAAWSGPGEGPWGFHVYTDQSEHLEPLGEGVLDEDGHISFLPGGEWILSDTYPDRKERKQRPYLFHVPTNRVVPLGEFHLPPEYNGEWRCDTHPRCSRDGTRIIIDSPHGGDGRQLWLIDVSAIISNSSRKPPMPSIEQLAARQLEAYNQADLVAFAAVYHPEVVVFNDNEESYRGREELRERYRGMFEHWQFGATVSQRMSMGPHCIDLEHWWRVNPETEERTEGDIMVRYTMRDGLIGWVQFLRPE